MCQMHITYVRGVGWLYFFMSVLQTPIIAACVTSNLYILTFFGKN